MDEADDEISASELCPLVRSKISLDEFAFDEEVQNVQTKPFPKRTMSQGTGTDWLRAIARTPSMLDRMTRSAVTAKALQISGSKPIGQAWRHVDSLSSKVESYRDNSPSTPSSSAVTKRLLHRSTFQPGVDMPSQKEAGKYYPLLLPIFIILLTIMILPQAAVVYFMYHDRGWKAVLAMMSWMPLPVVIPLWLCAIIWTVLVYVYHFWRLRGTEEPPPMPAAEPLIHCVVVCAYKEPLEVLCRTCETIADQKGLRRRPVLVFAAEARDETRHEVLEALRGRMQNRVEQLIMTEHVLCDGEAVGKSSNENFAVRSLYEKFVEQEGLDPFEVMVTIADADSLLSTAYLAHVEAAFRKQRDGRRLIFNGPLNTYRNLADADCLIQAYELLRCHGDTFHAMLKVPYPLSNYSLSLGLCAEIGFWTPDNMPEDIHTANKAMVNNFGSKTTVAIPAIICNDLVTGFTNRYVQAKRHQWGSVTELAWQIALLKDMGLSFPAWWATAHSENTREGSFFNFTAGISAYVAYVFILAVVANRWYDLPDNFKICLSLSVILVAWRWLWFWIAELWLWRYLMHQFPLHSPSFLHWLKLFVLMPVLSVACEFVYLVLPTIDCFYHVTFKGELAYIRAPKGDDLL